MEIKIARDVFLGGVQKAQGIVESKGAMPILSHLLIATAKDGLYIQATDLEIGIKSFLPAEIKSEGAVTLNARKLFDILRELPNADISLKKEENDWVALKCGKSRFRLPGLAAADFPTLPEYSEDALLEFKGEALKDMIRKTFFSVSPDETRQVLNGLLLEKDGEQVNLVGTDGHRLALIKRAPLKMNSGKDDTLSYLLPKKMLTELMKFLDEGDTPYSFSVKENHLAFIQDKQVIVSRRVEGKFPNYRQVIPADNEVKVKVNKDALEHGLKRVALLADDKSKMVRFEIRPGGITLVSDTTELGAANEEIPIEFDGEEVFIGLNARYVLDILSAVEQEEVTLNLKDENHSCLVTVDKDEDYLCIVMPMRL
jgi:DNA polymerase-3 subunit beta